MHSARVCVRTVVLACSRRRQPSVASPTGDVHSVGGAPVVASLLNFVRWMKLHDGGSEGIDSASRCIAGAAEF
eukprot:11179770-Lingulodinium_polyedra.AAC.1